MIQRTFVPRTYQLKDTVTLSHAEKCMQRSEVTHCICSNAIKIGDYTLKLWKACNFCIIRQNSAD